MDIYNFIQLHEIIQQHDQSTTIYRGVIDKDYKLLPKIGRKDINWNHRSIRDAEEYMLSLFKQRSIPFLKYYPQNDLEWLALAQHHGLPTRLLDWTRNPLVSAYFAVNKKTEADGAIYILKSKKYPISAKEEKKGPFEFNEVRKYIPSHITERIIAQSGLFTIHPEPDIEYTSKNVEKLIIKNNFKKELKHILFKYDIHKASLFPGLDGLSEHIMWLRSDIY